MFEGLLPSEIPGYLPHKRPFLFVDTVHEVTETHALSSYRFREDEYFYEGHFPNYRVTPGVILLEAMSQMGAAALGVYLLSREVPREELSRFDSIMTDCELELARPVFPGQRVICRAEKMLWRHRKLRARVELRHESGELAACAVIGGMSIPMGSRP